MPLLEVVQTRQISASIRLTDKLMVQPITVHNAACASMP